jgi:hypothetical protein
MCYTQKKRTNYDIYKTAALEIIQCSRFVYNFWHERDV